MDVDNDRTPLYVKLFDRAPIYDLILSCLSPRSLVWLTWTCRAIYHAVTEFNTRAFNINRHLSRYFADPIAFRNLQARTNTLVSGSNALQFLDRTFYPESDLDLYTHPGHAFEVAQFLVQAEGYQFVPGQELEENGKEWTDVIRNDWDGTRPRYTLSQLRMKRYPLNGITAAWNFTKTDARGETLKVQIIDAASSPVEVVLEFHTTCVMNFITADAAYALYPVATFVSRSALGLKDGRHAPNAVKKYVERGWRVYFVPSANHLAPNGPPFMFTQTRWVGDRHTWVLPLDQTGIRARPPLSAASARLTMDPVRCNGWRMDPREASLLHSYVCDWHRLQTTVFRYNYAVPDEEVWLGIRTWAHQQGKFSHRAELGKENWVWFDADLPGFLQGQWQRS